MCLRANIPPRQALCTARLRTWASSSAGQSVRWPASPSRFPAMADPSVSLILPAYNEAQTIGRTVEEAQTYFAQRGLDHEILLVAEGDDGTREIAADLARSDPSLHALG